MRIEFIYGPFSSAGKEFNFECLFEDPQGLTGSETSCFMLAKEMADLGHEVYLYANISTNLNHPCKWGKLEIRRLAWFNQARPTPEIVYSWNEPDLLKYVDRSVLRMVNQQLNDFDYCRENNWDQYVDIYTSPSPSHLDFISQFTPNKQKWQVVPNGHDPTLFDLMCKKNPGSVIYASSPDRGLHLLLQAWPTIKNAVPEATLKIFYDFMKWFNNAANIPDSCDIPSREAGQRAKYIYYALNRMKNGFGISHHKSVSKQHLAREMSRSMVLAYPCSCTRPTEGFSVTTLEACASGMVPILSSEDSLGQIYGGVAPMIRTPARLHLEEFTELVIKALIDEQFRYNVTQKTINFSRDFTWPKIAKNLERIMQEGLNRKKYEQ